MRPVVTLPDRARALLDFWFGPPADPGREQHREIWFRSNVEFDAALRREFLADYEAAAAGMLLELRRTGRSNAGSTRWSRLPGGCSSICHFITAKISLTNDARWRFPKPCLEIPIAAVLCAVTGAPISRSSSASGAFRTETKSSVGSRRRRKSHSWRSATGPPSSPDDAQSRAIGRRGRRSNPARPARRSPE